MAGLSYTIVPKANVRVENPFSFTPTLFAPSDKLILAPMQGLTSLFFRKAFSECFPDTVDYAVSPFISLTSGDVSKSKRKFRDVEPSANKGTMRVIPQLLGSNAEDMIMYLQKLSSMGYSHVNINLACPAKCAIKHNRGAALLKDYRQVDKLLSRVVPASTPLVSVKIRIGYDSTKDLASLIDALNSYPLHSVIAHPRVAVQIYEGNLDLQAFALIEQRIKHPLVYNGEIKTPFQFNQTKKQFPKTQSYMIGRGLLENPLLAAQIRGMNFPSSILKTFFFKLQKYYAEDFLGVGNEKEMSKDRQGIIAKAVLDKSKEFCKYLFAQNSERLTACRSLDELNANVYQIFR